MTVQYYIAVLNVTQFQLFSPLFITILLSPLPCLIYADYGPPPHPPPHGGYGPKCEIKYETIYVTSYETIYKDKCHTVYEQKCKTVYVTNYETKYEKKCTTDYVPKCVTTYDTVYEKSCGVSYDYKVRFYIISEVI